MKKIALIGAGGKMGMRLTRNLKNSAFEMSYVEISVAGIEKLGELGVEISKAENVVPEADVVILAVPDVALAKVSAEIIPQMKSGSIVMTLDPAVARAGRLFLREDVSYFIAHPSHPIGFQLGAHTRSTSRFFWRNARQTNHCLCADAGARNGLRTAKQLQKPCTHR
jgi:D-apionate oxidoisomerase